MKVEMEGREPLVLLFGLPIVTTGIVFASMYFGQSRTQVAPVVIENKQPLTARVQAEVQMPQGSVQIRNEIPSAPEAQAEAPAPRTYTRPATAEVPQKPEPPSTPVRAEPNDDPAKAPIKPGLNAKPTKPVMGPIYVPQAEVPATPESEGRLIPPPKNKPDTKQK